mgnify:CR=1 FL=1
MKIFAIRDESAARQIDLAYLLYYGRQKTFYIEVPKERTEWEVPLLVSSFVKRGEYTINAYWSKLWVQQRIVPADRQNLGQILKENGLSEYDEYRLLMLCNGRCAQDDYYLKPVTEEVGLIKERFRKKVEDVLVLQDMHLLIFFRNGEIRKCSMREYFEKEKRFRALLMYPASFEAVRVQPGGYGIGWNEDTVITDQELYRMGTKIPLSAGDFCRFAERNLVNSAEAAGILGCSRQNIEKMIDGGKLHPVKRFAKSTLLLRAEVERWKS